MNPDFACSIDWGIIAAWVGALATVTLVFVALFGYRVWEKQFFKQRDHDLAIRIVKSITSSHIVFDELRTPHALFSDSDVPVAQHEGDLPQPDDEFQKLFARYKARTNHLSAARAERTHLLFEAMVVWDDEAEFGMQMGRLINDLAPIERRVITEATIFVDSHRPHYPADEEKADIDVLFVKDDVEAEDATAAEYQTAKDAIFAHLGPKIRME